MVLYSWRLCLDDGEEKYSGGLGTFLKCIDKYSDQKFEIWYRIPYKGEGWKLLRTYDPASKCGCGRSYRIKNGTYFLGSFQPFVPVKNIHESIEILEKPFKCQVCFYNREILQGNWAPKEVYIVLGLPIPR